MGRSISAQQSEGRGNGASFLSMLLTLAQRRPLEGSVELNSTQEGSLLHKFRVIGTPEPCFTRNPDHGEQTLVSATL